MNERASPANVQLTRHKWLDEVAAAIGSAGLDWRVNGGSVEQNSPICYATVTRADRNGICRISVARDRFVTSDQRRPEILRQLLAGRRTR